MLMFNVALHEFSLNFSMHAYITTISKITSSQHVDHGVFIANKGASLH